MLIAGMEMIWQHSTCTGILETHAILGQNGKTSDGGTPDMIKTKIINFWFTIGASNGKLSWETGQT